MSGYFGHVDRDGIIPLNSQKMTVIKMPAPASDKTQLAQLCKFPGCGHFVYRDGLCYECDAQRQGIEEWNVRRLARLRAQREIREDTGQLLRAAIRGLFCGAVLALLVWLTVMIQTGGK